MMVSPFWIPLSTQTFLLAYTASLTERCESNGVVENCQVLGGNTFSVIAGYEHSECHLMP